MKGEKIKKTIRKEESTMDLKELADEKRRLSIRLFHEILAFEQKTGIEVTTIKVIRNEQGLESVNVKIEIPE
jgi:hypothetical protein